MQRLGTCSILAVLLAAVSIVGGCAVDVMDLPEHPVTSSFVPGGELAGPRPAAFEAQFARPSEDGLRVGDAVGVGLQLTRGERRETWFVSAEVVDPATEADSRPREPDDGSSVSVRMTLFDSNGQTLESVVRTAKRADLAASNYERYRELLALGAVELPAGRGPHASVGPQMRVAERLDRVVQGWRGDGSTFEKTQSAWLRGVKRLFSARLLSKELKTRFVEAAIGKISVIDAGLSLFTPPQVLIDVKKIAWFGPESSEYAAVSGLDPVVIPFVAAIGGSVRCRAGITFTAPRAPYSLCGGILASDLVNEAEASSGISVRLLFARRAE